MEQQFKESLSVQSSKLKKIRIINYALVAIIIIALIYGFIDIRESESAPPDSPLAGIFGLMSFLVAALLSLASLLFGVLLMLKARKIPESNNHSERGQTLFSGYVSIFIFLVVFFSWMYIIINY